MMIMMSKNNNTSSGSSNDNNDVKKKKNAVDEEENSSSSSSSTSSSIDNAMFGGLDFTTLDVTDITTTMADDKDEEVKESSEESKETHQQSYHHQQQDCYTTTDLSSSSSEREKKDNNNNNNNNSSSSSSNCYRQRVDELLKLQYDTNDILSRQQSESDNFHNLFDWVLQHEGSNLDGIKVGNDKYGGYTLYTKSSIKENTILAILPRKLRIGQNYACQQLNLPTSLAPTLSSLTLLILDFVHKNHPYAKCLPKQIPLDIFDKTKLHQIKQTMKPQYYHECIKLKSRYEACATYIKEYLSSSSTTSSTSSDNNDNNKLLYWAMSMVKSRTHSFGYSGSTSHFWITPIFGLLNHSITPNCKLVGQSDGSLALVSIMTINQNEEMLTIDYQVDDDAQLFATYGFSLL